LAGSGVENSRDVFIRGRIGRDDPVQLAQERQAGRGLPLEQHDDERERRLRLRPAVERLVVFRRLPFADSGVADEQNEGCRLRDRVGKLSGPGTASAQTRRREEDGQRWVFALDGGDEPLGQGLVRRVIAEEPTPHAFDPT
jgi:hypothetical protein